MTSENPPKGDKIRRVGLVFAGGPAPAANAVISAAAISFLEDGRDVVGFFHGFSNLQRYHPVEARLVPDEHYRVLHLKDVRGIRNTTGILIGTARTNPGRSIQSTEDLVDPEKSASLRNLYNALVDLRIDALVTIGGDGTLVTANLLHRLQQALPPAARRVRVVHVPKTIDNDYHGIDFTFGFFTAVDVIGKELQNLRADALATSSWYIVETMGRKAGWLSYGVGIAGEANLVLAIEDLDDSLMRPDPGGGPDVVDIDALANRIVDLMLDREKRELKHYGTVVLAEGIAERLPADIVARAKSEDSGAISLGKLDLGRMVAEAVRRLYRARTGHAKKVTSVQLGYESRCAPAHAFDIMLGSQLGIGAYRALVEEGLDAHMVSVSGQLDLRYVPFADLVDASGFRTATRFIRTGSDFHRLARFLESRVEGAGWSLGRRREPTS